MKERGLMRRAGAVEDEMNYTLADRKVYSSALLKRTFILTTRVLAYWQAT
jgi:hypothetical protein